MASGRPEPLTIRLKGTQDAAERALLAVVSADPSLAAEVGQLLGVILESGPGARLELLAVAGEPSPRSYTVQHAAGHLRDFAPGDAVMRRTTFCSLAVTGDERWSDASDTFRMLTRLLGLEIIMEACEYASRSRASCLDRDPRVSDARHVMLSVPGLLQLAPSRLVGLRLDGTTFTTKHAGLLAVVQAIVREQAAPAC